MVEKGGSSRRDEISRMWADAVLPEDIRPASGRAADPPRVALLTGACGFLGRRVALELLRHSDFHLICLVRPKAEETAAERVARIFVAMGVGQEELERRVEVWVGDMTAPDLGLEADAYADLTGRVDAIYHCAAQVDWVRGYAQLYRINVGGVLALISLACQGRAKRLIFASSIAVCFSETGPERIDEHTDMLPFIGGMPLGYARTKCVAEALLRQAADRGVTVTVLRPSLIAGDSATGESSPVDMIAALVQGCIVTGMAIDTDWLLDCVPVDFVAHVMASVPQAGVNFQILNLVHERPRYWRELILWMNLHGYSVDLVESNAWIRHLFAERHGFGTMLYAHRQFFSGRALPGGGAKQPRPYEAYLATGQRRIDSMRTRTLLRSFGLREAPLDTDLLHAYFEYYRKVAVIPPRARNGEGIATLDDLLNGDWLPRDRHGSTHRWAATERMRIGSDDGLLSEIASARSGGSVGLWRLSLRSGKTNGEDLPDCAVLKAKASDRLIQDLTVQLAGVCKPELGRLFGQYPDALGLAGSHERELALYELEEPRLRQHMPACYGTLRNPDGGRWALLQEYLPEAEAGVERPRLLANDTGMSAVLEGLAQIHSVWYRREKELTAQPWLAAMPDLPRMQEMIPLWRELADFSAPWFEIWCGQGVREFQTDFICNLDSWWPRLYGMPSTLIHNDFNPRNLVLRRSDAKPSLCAYDWELATLGIPQHDLAELLCFTWHSGMAEIDLDTIVDSYRISLSRACDQEIDLLEWRDGFALALRHLLINRLPMYTLMHCFRPLGYLPRVMGNWKQLYIWSRNWSVGFDRRC